MTGRGAGYCAGYPVPGYANPYVPGWGRGRGGGRGWGRGYGWGRGRGGGRGWGFGRGGWHGPDYALPVAPPMYYSPARAHGYYGSSPYPYANPRPDDEIEYLEEAANDVEQELEMIRTRIGELRKELKKKE